MALTPNKMLCLKRSLSNAAGTTIIDSGKQLFRSRFASSAASLDRNLSPNTHSSNVAPSTTTPRLLERMRTINLLRNMFLGLFFSSPTLFKLGFPILKKIASSDTLLCNPDKNPVLRAIVKPLVYDQFCAGTSAKEVRRTVANIKSLGYSGVILCAGREVDIQDSALAATSLNDEFDAEIATWEKANLETLTMIGAGDFMGIKYTGAGHAIYKHLLQGNSPPKQFSMALNKIAKTATSQGTRIWIDAEKQALQPTIDAWTVDLMRRHNLHGQAWVYNTLQAYLKGSKKVLAQHMSLAQHENWTLAIKLVRGAYIASDSRDSIHCTKAETDACYNDIVRALMTREHVLPASSPLPSLAAKTALFIAGHNPESVAAAGQIARELAQSGHLDAVPEFGQLQGMADELGCKLLRDSKTAQANSGGRSELIHKVYKCLPWGSVQDCMQYLVRRAVENQGATGRMQEGLSETMKELRHRFFERIPGWK